MLYWKKQRKQTSNRKADAVIDPIDDQPQNRHPTSVDILGVEIDCVDFMALLAQIGAWIDEAHTANAPSHCHQICTVNPEFIMEARRNPGFSAALNRAGLRVPDEVGVLWASRVNGVRLRERVTGSDGIYRISERAATAGWRVFLLGAAPGIAAQTAAKLQARYPTLTIVGTHGGSPAMEEWAEIERQLTAARPDILFVAFGHPKQDIWIDAHRAELTATVAIGVGGAFDFVAGVTVRAPGWMQRVGLEWLYRLRREPWRWRRMRTLPVFVVQVLLDKVRG